MSATNCSSDPFIPEPYLKKIEWPSDLRAPSSSECQALGTLRKLDPCAFYTAGRLGTLRIGTVYSHLCWIFTDQLGLCAEARRVDGQKWYQGQKSISLQGSVKAQPIGLSTWNPAFDKLPNIVLLEGAPDYFAALTLAIESPVNFRPAAILGSACQIKELDPRTPARGARILIIPHNDEPGKKAATNWSIALYRQGAARVRIQLLPDGTKDLNELVSTSPNQAQTLINSLA